MTRAAAAQVTEYTGTFPGLPDQVQHARHAVARYLDGHPVTDDAVLIVSELASNAVLHSDSAGGFFTVSVELHETYCYIEVEEHRRGLARQAPRRSPPARVRRGGCARGCG